MGVIALLLGPAKIAEETALGRAATGKTGHRKMAGLITNE